MEQLSYTQSIVDQNIVMRHVTELLLQMHPKNVHIYIYFFFFLNKFMK